MTTRLSFRRAYSVVTEGEKSMTTRGEAVLPEGTYWGRNL